MGPWAGLMSEHDDDCFAKIFKPKKSNYVGREELSFSGIKKVARGWSILNSMVNTNANHQ